MTTTSPEYDQGEVARISSETFLTQNGIEVNPDSVQIVIQAPDTSESTYVFGTDDEVVRDSAGVYHIDVSVSSGGVWRYRWEAAGTANDIQFGAFYARANPLNDVVTDYVTSDELKDTLDLADQSFIDRDIELAITAASRAIDKLCNRRFFLDADATSVRYYTPNERRRLKIDDVVTLASLAVDQDGNGTFEQTWTQNSDFVLDPLNAAADGEPYTEIRVHRLGRYLFPQCLDRSVKVTAKFGWTSPPAGVKSATAMLASRLLKRTREAPFGVAGFGMDGAVVSIARNDPDVMGLVKPYIRSRITVA